MYYVVYGLLWLVSLLPLRALYLISDGIYFLLYHIFKYRKAVVMQNLQAAFPEKSEKERLVIAKKFYRNLADSFVETLKMISASDKFILKRFSANWNTLHALNKTERPAQLHLGHNFNWEWFNIAMARNIGFNFLVVYMPVRNKVFDRLLYRLRSRSGSKLLKATTMTEDFLPYRNTKYLLALAADQNPGHPANAWWFHFLGRPAPFVKGPAKNAVRNNTSVVFAFIRKPKRGYYEAELSLVADHSQTFSQEELTRRFVRFMEKVIRQNPEMWLWSHRRWKWQWKEEYGAVLD